MKQSIFLWIASIFIRVSCNNLPAGEKQLSDRDRMMLKKLLKGN
jgi:hypothetical protein